VAVYHVNWVRFPAGALAVPVLPTWRRWFARLSEKQEDPVRFQGSALEAVPAVCRPCSGSSLDSKSERAGFNSLTACHALVAQLEERRFRKPEAVGSNPTRGSRSTGRVLLPWPRGEAPERHSGQCGFESRRQLLFHGLVFQRENARFAPERPGFESRRVHFLVSGSVAQVDESVRLRTVRSQVQVLPEPLFAPVAQSDESARFRTVRPQVQSLPGVLEASVAQWIESGRVLSARSQVRILPGAHMQHFTAEGGRRPTGSHTPEAQGSTPCSATSHARRASWRRRRSHTPISLGSIPRACTFKPE
jgi:hypothetical protein